MTEDADFVREWARLAQAIRAIEEESKEKKAKFLKANGHTWTSYKDVMDRAVQQMGQTVSVDTEYGTVTRFNRPYYVHAGKGQEYERWYLSLTEGSRGTEENPL